MQKKTFPGEKEEMPVTPNKPEIERPGDPKTPEIPQEDPNRIPPEITPQQQPPPEAPPGQPGNTPNG
ncbi:MAG TPA: hypothetical protein VJ844_05100 [Mucilaginibacter sp.]|nr:hypothetical protein [Mucilaginibacter sp.]